MFDGKLATAAGVSAGIDMALALAAKIASEQVAQAIQLGIEYDPQPPFDAGSPEGAAGGRRAGARLLALRRVSKIRRMSRQPVWNPKQLLAASALSVFEPRATERAASSTFLLGQVMFLVAIALGFAAAGTYIGRDLGFGTGLIFEFGSLAMLIVQMFVPSLREGPTGMTWMFALALLLGSGWGR